MQVSCKSIITFTFIFLFLISNSYAYEQCNWMTTVDDVPCIITLPVNTSLTSCSSINFTLFKENVSIYTQQMEYYNNFTCSANFTQTSVGQYSHYFSTGDSGAINLVEGLNMVYLLFFIFAILVGLVILAYYTDDYFYHTFVSFLIIIFGLYLLTNGFNGLVNVLTQTSGIMFIALGMYFFIPSLTFAVDSLNSWG